MPSVSITRLRVREQEFVEPFFLGAVAADEQALAAPGNLGVEVLGDTSNAYWTKSAWVDRAAMRAFMTSGVHAELMPRLREWCDEAHVAHWEQESDELPSWQEAHRRLVAEGRASAIEHPSQAHRSRNIPAPVVSPS